MTYPILELSRFELIHRTHHIIDTCKYVAADEEGSAFTMADYMRDCIHRTKNYGDEPRNWSFASYKTNKHVKSAIRHNTAVTLEYGESARSDVMAELADMGFAHWIVDTETTTENRFAVIIPLATPVLNESKSNRYSRLASVLLQQIGAAQAVEGCIAATFLFCPRASAKVQAFAGNILDAETYIKETAELRAKANEFINKAKDEDDEDEALFDWGNA